MRFFEVILPLALLASPILAAPAERKADTVTCTAKDITNPKKVKNVSWKISVETAKAEMKKAGISTQGKTGYPHPYRNKEKLNWSVATCKKTNIDLLEYPVFWEGHRQTDNTKLTNQQAVSPIRVVYANDGGVMVYCGVMTHTEAEKMENVGGQESWKGSEGFHICT